MRPGFDFPGVAIAFFCHDGNGKLLFQRHSPDVKKYPNHWNCGSGMVEHGETFEDALARELMEEYGCTGTIDHDFGTDHYFYNDEVGNTHWVTNKYLVRVNRDEVINNEPHKVAEIAWFRWEDLPSPLHPGAVKDVETFRDILGNL